MIDMGDDGEISNVLNVHDSFKSFVYQKGRGEQLPAGFRGLTCAAYR